MDEKFAFTPTAEENEEALKSLSRSMMGEGQQPLRRLVNCLVVYGLPLAFALIVFPESFHAIYLTFVVFIIILIAFTRLGFGTTSAAAGKFVVPLKVRFNRSGITQDAQGHAYMRWRWPLLKRLHVLPNLVMLEFDDSSWLPLPNRLWLEEEKRAQFVESVREKAPNLLPDLPSAHVPSPFSLINVGAGFAGADLFLLAIFALHENATAAEPWPFPLDISVQMIPAAFGVLTAIALSIAVLGFFLVRRVLHLLHRRHPRLANYSAGLFIAIFAAVVLAGLLRHPCGC